MCESVFFCQAEDGIRALVRSRGLGDVYKRQPGHRFFIGASVAKEYLKFGKTTFGIFWQGIQGNGCLLYTSDAADERSSVDLGGRRIIKKKTRLGNTGLSQSINTHET